MNILIVDTKSVIPSEFRDFLISKCASVDVVYTFNTALILMCHKEYDILVCDELGNYEVPAYIKKSPKIFMLTSKEVVYSSDDFSKSNFDFVADISIDFDTLYNVMISDNISDDISVPEESNEDSVPNTTRIKDFLIYLGIKPNLLGFNYITYAVSRCLEDNSLLHSITKRLYPEIADYFGVSECAVERGIRTAIGTINNPTNLYRINVLFGRKVITEEAYFTNSRFLSTLVEGFSHSKTNK